MLVRTQLPTQISIKTVNLNENNNQIFELNTLLSKELILLNLTDIDYQKYDLLFDQSLMMDDNGNFINWYDYYKNSFNKQIKKLIKKFFNLNIYKSKLNNKKLNLIYLKYVNYLNFKNYFLINKKYIFLKNYFLFILNIKKKKPFVNIIIKDKVLLAVSSGFILKKLNISEKKSKKSLKTLYLMLKIIINNLNKNFFNYKKIICQIKGSKKRLFQIILFLKKKIKFNNIIFIYTPNFYQNSIKFKKIKSIKKRLRKKFIKQ